MKIKPIKTDEDYRKSLELLKEIWPADQGPFATQEQADEFDILTVLIEDYERNNGGIDLRTVRGGEPNLYLYNAEVVKIVDGDTIRFRVDKGFHSSHEANMRLTGIDTPEIRGVERPLGLKSKEALEELLAGSRRIVIKTEKQPGKFGRFLCTVFAQKNEKTGDAVHHVWINVNQWLLDNGYAEVYGK